MNAPAQLTRRRLIRRSLALAALLSPLGAARAVPYQADGPARVVAGALKATLLDITTAGSRLVAVGERGHVLLSDDQGQAWRQARAVPTRTTLTCVHATSAKLLWAAGHGGLILVSTDGGESWSRRHGSADGPDVLLAIRVQTDGQGLAVGGFGIALATGDGGQTWQAKSLVDGEDGERHLNRILVTPAGTWLIAAEGGQVLRGTGAAASPGAMAWAGVKTPYKGSLWTGLQLPGGTVVLGGMRGNLVRSSDDGLGWTHQPVADAGSLTGAAVLADGRPLFVGVDGTQVLGDPAAQAWRLQRRADRSTLSAVVSLPGGAVVAASGAGPLRLTLPA